MSTTSLRAGRRLRAAVVAAAACLVLSVSVPAVADEASDAPVTIDDSLSLDASSTEVIDVLENDSDPNGDDLAICRISVPAKAPLYVDDVEGVLFVSSTTNVTGSYEITYYACDFDYLTPGTLTVEVTKVPVVRATKARSPGRVKFVNPGDRRVVVLYGSRREDRPDGRVRVGGHSAATITATRTNIFYVAFVRRSGTFAGSGTVKNIRLSHAGSRPVPPALGAAAERVWSSAR